jgi:hypothetical protein
LFAVLQADGHWLFSALRSLFRGTEHRSTSQSGSLQDPLTALLLCGHGPTMSGINISPQTALRCSVVFGCVKVLSETVGKRPDGGRDVADDHPLHWLLADAPNEWTPASEFKLSMTARWCLDGSAYAFVSRVLAGGNENAPDDMGALVRSLDRLRDELHCHVCAVAPHRQ